VNIPVMVNPICPRCGHSGFGIKEIVIQNATYRHFAIICTHCGCIVSTETMQDDERANQLKSELVALKQQLQTMTNALQRHGIY